MEFNASFNEEVTWTLSIKGKTSKSIKRYSGRSKEINETWYGEPDTAVFFQAEECEVVLKISCKEALTSTFTITAASGFNNMPGTFLVSNFDGGGTSWSAYPSTLLTHNGVIASPSDPSPQGAGYYKIEGSGALNYYFGGCGSGPFALPSSWTDPRQVYLNVFLNSDGLTNSQAQITLSGGGGVTYMKTVNWTGWKLVSFKLSEIEIQNPTTVTSLNVGLGSAPDRGTSASVKMDFFIFTYGKPFYKETGI
jgi:hypothetical protein